MVGINKSWEFGLNCINECGRCVWELSMCLEYMSNHALHVMKWEL